ncbi:hypothetical protein ACFFU1_11325 [Algibacter miyuki]|uniref:Lipoprotein n=1 Tax=Algibacter miyuki TaxID=1306933 RepID=A0ABV5H0R4_9FLAO|nr:hypothetical protein [Algibacter miyuki]MDN3664109.1 hypothetical protein [Algibacter miyuki]
MKRLLLLTVLLSLLMSCSSRKQLEKAINTGNYNHAITEALKKLETNKDKKSKGDYILMLQDAYSKAVDKDLNTIKHLQKDNNPVQYEDVLNLYTDLNTRQEAIKPVLPLSVNGKNINFKLNDYSNEISEYRDKTSNYLYEKGLELLETDNKFNIREAYDIYSYIESINPNYDNTRELLQEAHQRGIINVLVSSVNKTNQVIPKELEADLLNFDTYGLNQFWITYHAMPDKITSYDYGMQLQFQQINMSPEQIKERQIVREKSIIDGKEYLLDKKGNVKKDSLGNDIKVNKIIKIKAVLYEVQQQKSSQILANVVYKDLKTNKILDNFPIDSGFTFQNLFATYRGDKRALTTEDLNILRNRKVPFPTTEQMIFDTGEDIKQKLKDIISSYNPL